MAHVQSVVSANCIHKSLHDQNKLLEICTECDEICDGTLGDWTSGPIFFEVKEGAKPYYDRQFPVPRVYKETIVKGVLEF